MSAASERVLTGLPSEVGGILRRQWLLAAPPAALLGVGTDLLAVAHGDLVAAIAGGLLLAVAFEVYVGYAELIVAIDRGASARRHAGHLLRRAAPLAPPLLAASVVAVSLPFAATGLLVIPGFWLLTKWSLFAPAIVHERLGPRAALARSTALVRGAFWPVAATVTASILIEHAVINATAHTAESAVGSHALGLVVAGIATALVSAPAAFTISVVYERLAGDLPTPPAGGRAHPRPAVVPESRSAVSYDSRSE